MLFHLGLRLVTGCCIATMACSSDTKERPPVDTPPKKIAPAVSKPKEETPPLPKARHKMARGDARRSGQSAQNGPRAATLKWVFRTADRIYADPIVAPDGTVFVGSHDGHLYAIDPTGREKWSVDTGGKVWSSPAIAEDGTVYVGSDADTLYAVDPTGRIKWTLNTTMPPQKKGQKDPAGMWDVDTAPALGPDGTIYFGCHYFLYAIRPTGEVRWRFQAGTGRVKVFSSPAIGDNGHIYFGTQGKRFFAIDANSNVLWNVETGKDNDSTPVVDREGRIYFASDDGVIRALAPEDGRVIWSTEVSAPMRAPLAIGSDNTLFAATYGREPFVIALDGADGKERWRFKTEPGEGAFYGIQSGITVDKEGFLYFGARDHYVYCLTPAGKLKWRYKTGDQVDSSPVIGPDGTLYVGSDDKRLYAFAPTDHPQSEDQDAGASASPPPPPRKNNGIRTSQKK